MKDGWQFRRRLLYLTSAFYALVIAYCLLKANDTELFRTACSFAFLALSSNIGCYVFGSSWESIGMAKQGFLKKNTDFETADQPKKDPD